jgi:hypothetical protein
MKLPEEEIRRLVSQWLEKAALDFETVVRLVGEERFRDVAVFHAQQAAEKYLKALLTRHQIEFPKTHVIRHLLTLLRPVEPAVADELATPTGSVPSARRFATQATCRRPRLATRHGHFASRRRCEKQ